MHQTTELIENLQNEVNKLKLENIKLRHELELLKLNNEINEQRKRRRIDFSVANQEEYFDLFE